MGSVSQQMIIGQAKTKIIRSSNLLTFYQPWNNQSEQMNDEGHTVWSCVADLHIVENSAFHRPWKRCKVRFDAFVKATVFREGRN